MPKPPYFHSNVLNMPGAVYSPFAEKMEGHPGPLFPLHVGDTWLEPSVGTRSEDILAADHPGLHQYCDTRGLPPLVDAVLERSRERSGLSYERSSVLITAGATAGLSCALGSVLAPGEEVLILAPFWPLIRGIVQSWGGHPVEVPFYDRVWDEESAIEAVRALATEKTVALYISSPSNPTGRVLSTEILMALADLAESEDWWLLSDEVYKDFVYSGEHTPVAPLAPTRTLTVDSFSKAYGMAGYRVGTLVGPEEWVSQALKIGTHSFYNAPTSMQWAALEALRGGDGWQAKARAQYKDVSRSAAETLGLPAPDGSTFLFLDVSQSLDERGLTGFLEDCFTDGVLIAPGSSSGAEYGQWVRVCYTVMPPEATLEGIRRLARHVKQEGSGV
ncbi:MAG: aspartate aminotransferase [Deltaproteobacteria bacterium]|nr:aspartate aminotransferase [Deltaproteobacteria bacterium]